MAQLPLDEGKLKELLKSAIVEVLDERRDWMRDLVEEAVEDIALAHAIEEGESTGTASREDVFRVLSGGE